MCRRHIFSQRVCLLHDLLCWDLGGHYGELELQAVRVWQVPDHCRRHILNAVYRLSSRQLRGWHRHHGLHQLPNRHLLDCDRSGCVNGLHKLRGGDVSVEHGGRCL